MLGPDGRVLIARADIASGFVSRAIGLMGRRGMGPGRALYLTPCSSVHTGFMRFPLDLVFLDASLRVVRIVRGLDPWRAALGGAGARGVLEVESGWLPAEVVRVGDALRLSPA